MDLYNTHTHTRTRTLQCLLEVSLNMWAREVLAYLRLVNCWLFAGRLNALYHKACKTENITCKHSVLCNSCYLVQLHSLLPPPKKEEETSVSKISEKHQTKHVICFLPVSDHHLQAVTASVLYVQWEFKTTSILISQFYQLKYYRSFNYFTSCIMLWTDKVQFTFNYGANFYQYSGPIQRSSQTSLCLCDCQVVLLNCCFVWYLEFFMCLKV